MNALRHELRLKPVELDLNLLVTEALAILNGTLETKLVTKFDQVPKILADRQQLAKRIYEPPSQRARCGRHEWPDHGGDDSTG